MLQITATSEQSANVRAFDELGTLKEATFTGTTAVVQTETRVLEGYDVFVEASGLQNAPKLKLLAIDSKGEGDSGQMETLTGFSAGSGSYAVVFGRAVMLYDCGEDQFVDLTQCTT